MRTILNGMDICLKRMDYYTNQGHYRQPAFDWIQWGLMHGISNLVLLDILLFKLAISGSL